MAAGVGDFPGHKHRDLGKRRLAEADGDHHAEQPQEVSWLVFLMRLSDRLIASVKMTGCVARTASTSATMHSIQQHSSSQT